MITEDTNDLTPADPGKELPALLDGHLRAIMPDKDLNRFRDQLPAEFLSDANEGLEQLKDTKQLETVLQQLNQQMHHQLKHKKINKKRGFRGDLSWAYWAIGIIFLITITGFIIVRMLLRH